MQDLSSPTRDRTRTPCIRRQSLNHWTAREVPKESFSTELVGFSIRGFRALEVILTCAVHHPPTLSPPSRANPPSLGKIGFRKKEIGCFHFVGFFGFFCLFVCLFVFYLTSFFYFPPTLRVLQSMHIFALENRF